MDPVNQWLSDTIVRLNVGGQIFTTRAETLSRHSPYFAARLRRAYDASKTTCDLDWTSGKEMLDFDPGDFGILLNFWRGGHGMPESDRLRIRGLLDYLGVDPESIAMEDLDLRQICGRYGIPQLWISSSSTIPENGDKWAWDLALNYGVVAMEFCLVFINCTYTMSNEMSILHYIRDRVDKLSVYVDQSEHPLLVLDGTTLIAEMILRDSLPESLNSWSWRIRLPLDLSIPSFVEGCSRCLQFKMETKGRSNRLPEKCAAQVRGSSLPESIILRNRDRTFSYLIRHVSKLGENLRTVQLAKNQCDGIYCNRSHHAINSVALSANRSFTLDSSHMESIIAFSTQTKQIPKKMRETMSAMEMTLITASPNIAHDRFDQSTEHAN